MSDSNMHWDGTRWLRYNGQQWVDAETGSPVGVAGTTAVPPPPPPGAGPPARAGRLSSTAIILIIVGAVVAVLVIIAVVFVAMYAQVSSPTPSPVPSSSTPSPASPSASPSASATTTPPEVAAVVSAITAVDNELVAYNKAVKKAGRTHDYAPALADLDQAQRNVATVNSLAAQVQWPPVETPTMATAAQIDAYEAAATQWIDIQRKIAIGLQACFNSGGTAACVDKVSERTQAAEVKAAAAYRSAWIALGGTAQ